ncbi:hypothetical protein TNCV_3502101 [Trichonephila clavipes]|uniref:Uncharacterized protein n=1 Tax=Trichonephila clavipes TaxID=2585209 RepID=A0A8X6S8B3_TRICX|nr:hypothetical protein TNCV_3502101 [Trichonephila clavipes]
MTPVEDPAIVFASAQLILLYLGTAAVAFPARSRHALLAKRSGDLAGHAWVKISSTICELSKCLEGPLKMIVCPQLLPTLSHLVKLPLDNKCRIESLAGAPPDTCAVVISTETESGFIAEDDTSPVCHTPSCPRSAKSSRHCL